jgi:hypothetical protein
MTVSYTELKTVGTRLDKSIPADGFDTTPKAHDYLNIPNWITKFVPASSGVFVQDEVNVVIRQEPHSRKALDIIETDENIVKACKKIYLSSRLSELSRPEDMREYDMDVEGVKEMFLEEVIARVWREALPNEVKGRLFMLTDDFVRAICIRRAFTDIEKDLSTPLNFCKAIRRLLLANAQMFLAFKMSKMERWRYILETPEFPEDVDKPYISDDDDSDIEDKDDATELTTKDDEETETKMSESIAELPSVLESDQEQKSMLGGSLELLSVDEGGDKKTVGDASTVEGLFDRNMDNVSLVPKSEESERVKDEKDLDEGGEKQAGDEKEPAGEDNGEEGEGGEDQEEEKKEEEKLEEEEEEEEGVEDGTPPEDLPQTDSEKLALSQVNTLYNLNWRRLEKKREIGEKLSFMTTHHLS